VIKPLLKKNAARPPAPYLWQLRRKSVQKALSRSSSSLNTSMDATLVAAAGLAVGTPPGNSWLTQRRAESVVENDEYLKQLGLPSSQTVITASGSNASDHEDAQDVDHGTLTSDHEDAHDMDYQPESDDADSGEDIIQDDENEAQDDEDQTQIEQTKANDINNEAEINQEETMDETVFDISTFEDELQLDQLDHPIHNTLMIQRMGSSITKQYPCGFCLGYTATQMQRHLELKHSEFSAVKLVLNYKKQLQEETIAEPMSKVFKATIKQKLKDAQQLALNHVVYKHNMNVIKDKSGN
jgi:hypothetical protein